MRRDRFVSKTDRVVALALGGLLFAAPAFAGEREHRRGHGKGHDWGEWCEGGGERGKGREGELDRERVQRMVQRALPAWGEEVLEVPADPNRWAEDVTFDKLLGVLGDKDPLPQGLPEGSLLVRDADRAIRLEPAQGKFRYVNRKRAWSFERDSRKHAVDPAKAQQMVLAVARELGAPLPQILDSRAETQMGAGAIAGAPRASEAFEMYRLVLLSRQVGELTVYGSSLRAALSHDGQIERMQVSWPAFSLAPGLRLRPRGAVVSDAVKRILDQNPGRDTRVRARLVYAPEEDERKAVRFLPAVQVAVLSLPTPYFVIVPVAEGTDGDEEEVGVN
jgi:hypothetical protein